MVCVRRCTIRFELDANACAHPSKLQRNGRSPVCDRRCLVRFDASANARPQPGHEHTCGRSWVACASAGAEVAVEAVAAAAVALACVPCCVRHAISVAAALWSAADSDDDMHVAAATAALR